MLWNVDSEIVASICGMMATIRVTAMLGGDPQKERNIIWSQEENGIDVS